VGVGVFATVVEGVAPCLSAATAAPIRCCSDSMPAHRGGRPSWLRGGGRHACRSEEEASQVAAACQGIIEEAAAIVGEGGGCIKEGGDGALKKVEV
jgi:hypothetical protein